jgi:hypothetical protein
MTVTVDELHLAFFSRLAPHCDYRAFGAISRTARARNAQAGIAGILLFDGERFFQWLYGSPAATSRLMSTIALDRRHTDICVRLEALLPAIGFNATWRAGFVDAQALDEVAAIGHGDGAQLLSAIAQLVAHADLEPPLAIPALTEWRSTSGCDMA